jgi:hypothetical protein
VGIIFVVAMVDTEEEEDENVDGWMVVTVFRLGGTGAGTLVVAAARVANVVDAFVSVGRIACVFLIKSRA